MVIKTKAQLKEPPREALVAIKDITFDDTLQVRSKMDEKTIDQYADAMKAGQLDDFPPITLASIGNSLILVDGWHRTMAAVRTDEINIKAIIQTMTREEAIWAAAEANRKHGLPLKAKEYREVFRAFMNAKKYRIGHRWLSYNDIAKIIGKAKGTIQNWMTQDYPRLAKQFSRPSEQRDDVQPPDHKALWLKQAVKEVKMGIDDARNLARELPPEQLGEIIGKLEDTLQELQERPHVAPDPVRYLDDF